MIRKKILIIATCLAIILSSCSKSNKQGKLIPKEAAMVVVIDGKSMNSKLDFNKIRNSEWFREANEDSTKPAWVNKVLQDSGNIGVDMKSNLVFVYLKNTVRSQFLIEGDLKDAKTFEDFLKMADSSITVKKDGDYSFASHKNGVVGWNSSKFICCINGPDNVIYDDSTHAPAFNNETELLTEKIKSVFNLKSDSSLADNERFTNMLNEEGDIHLWFNNQELAGNMMPGGVMGMINLDKFFEENIATITINFENGKISARQKFYAGKELSNILDKYSGGEVNTEMLKNIPSKNIAGIFAMHFKPEGIQDLVKLTGMEGFINIFLMQAGFTMDDFIQGNKGDILFVASNIRREKDTTFYPVQKDVERPDSTTRTDYLFSVAIGDKDAFMKLVNAAKKMTGDMHRPDEIRSKMNEKYLALGNSQDVVNNFIAGNAQSNSDLISKLSGHPYSGFVDIKMILNSLGSLANDSIKLAMLELNRNMWDNIFMTGGEYKKGGIVTDYEVNFQDKTTNSLVQLNDFAGKASLLVKEHNKQRELHNTDSTTIIPIPPAFDTTAAPKGKTKLHKKRK